MPTPAHSHVIPSDPLPSDIEAVVSEAVKHLEEVRNFGTYVLKWLAEAPPPVPLRLTPLILIRHTVELMDSIYILIQHHNVDPAQIILRTLFEAWLNVRFLTCDDLEPSEQTFQKVSERSAAYMVCYLHQRRKRNETYDPDSEAGKRRKAEIEKDQYVPNDLLEKLPKDVKDEVKKSIERIDRELTQMEATYQSLQSGDRSDRPKPWYRLAGGPKNIQELARLFSLGEFYNQFYRSMSGMVHGSDILEGRISMSKREDFAAIKQVRLLTNFDYVVKFSLVCSTSIYRHVINTYDPKHSEECRRWYLKEVIMDELPSLKESGLILNIEYNVISFPW